jgi:hypothetical protein
VPKLSDIRRIVPEEFKAEDQDMASSIAGSYNEFADELYSIVNGALDFENLARRKVDIDLNVGANGSITGNATVNTSLSFVSGIIVMNAVCTSNSALRLTASPFASFSYKGNGQFTINYLLGVPSGKWRLTLEVIQ